MNDLSPMGNEAVKILPPVTVAGVTFLGFNLQEWVYITTIIYTVLQVVITLRGLYKERYGKVSKDSSD